MRIFIGNIEIAGYFSKLKDGFEKNGVHADFWALMSNKYYASHGNILLSINHKLFSYYSKHKRGVLLPTLIFPFLGMVLIHASILIYALFRYDVFILNAVPFFNYIELCILKLFKKKIIVVFLGSDARPAYISGDMIHGRFMTDGTLNLESCHRMVRDQVRKINRIEKYADHIINHPPSALFHKKPFIAWLHIGFPHIKPAETTSVNARSSRIVRVLHAPTNPSVKGTKEIQKIIRKLQYEGLPVMLINLENVPNEMVLRAIGQCDIVVDELYSDIPIGGLGTEAAFAGKSVINAGYYFDSIGNDYQADVIPPSCFCSPDALESAIREFVTNREKRAATGMQLQNYVSRHWDNALVASRYLRIINDDIPEEWLFCPQNISYFSGYGIREGKLRNFLHAYLSRFGNDALFLQDKPVLSKRITDFAFQTN
jgi:glycosyltransferase involved in cell wall biosynthesis